MLALASQSQLDLAHYYLQKTLLSSVYDVAKVTPLSSLNKLSARLGCQVFLKREDMQPVHSFKLRGAYNKIAELSKEECECGVVCASAGNHAQGVAMSASARGISAVIVMPETTPDIKVDAVRRLGGEVVLYGQAFDQANAHAQSLARDEGRVYVAPFDDEAVIAGQGTVAQEMLQQQRDLEVVFVPVGGGGLIAGVAAYYKAVMPQVKIIGVEPEDSACLKAALEADERVVLPQVGLFADGVAVKQIGAEPFRLAREYVDDVITVSSDEICAAVKDIFEDTRAIAEPSGALSLAGLKKYIGSSGKGEKVAAILSGANVNFHSLRYVSERCELGEQKEAILAVKVPERPGVFLRFCELLDKRAMTEFNYRFSSRDKAVVFAGIRLTQGQSELDEIIARLESEGFGVQDLSNDETAKLHVRYMVGGQPPEPIEERLFSFEFPEHPGALFKFLTTLQSKWNISLFHYRNHGAAYGRVLAGFEVPESDNLAFKQFLTELGFVYQEETDSPAYQLFLDNRSE
ncbi:threonine ammonia-lyase, biosynthetic [Shewanella schlegeliana]|uniref:L-threonine dehydratase n=1 Tax=Shewanella schlegeliana TaxID=190308 RepID=A0ABS1T2D2_9GAMM|nr:threonine ammonia-lyase, biosynthetic [Shewanella schlegeliana]MBL4914951.1 threonine ammonia-lyase, biosynthetic [Shewanella schlegeliana]MCL1110637.1 threonine ammonia-lyase, biosynthetic [Shewanella schlegeliana]GIU37525.1 L-threonine dehydratase [Shewanella schlegeliana]